MPLMVHLTAEKNSKGIIRSGIHKGRGVYCMPVQPNYYLTHQWLRELRRGGQRMLVAVYFRVENDEMVWSGHYSQPHSLVPLKDALHQIMASTDPQGYEVIIQRAILPGEIHRVRHLPQTIGWRYRPFAHGKPFCICPACVRRGEIKSGKLRERYRTGRSNMVGRGGT